MIRPTPASLRTAAWDDLRAYVLRPHLYTRHSNESAFLRNVWNAYFAGRGQYNSYDDFVTEAKVRMAGYRKRKEQIGQQRQRRTKAGLVSVN